MFIYLKKVILIKSCIITEKEAAGSAIFKFITYTILERLSFIFLITFIFWVRFVNPKTNTIVDIPSFLKEAKNDGPLITFGMLYVCFFVISHVSSKKKDEYYLLCQQNIEQYMKIFTQLQTKKQLFENTMNARDTYKKCNEIKKNLLKMLESWNLGLVPFVIQILLFIIIICLLLGDNPWTWKPILPIVAGVALFLVGFISFNYFLFKKTGVLNDKYKNEISTLRKLGVTEEIKTCFQKDYKIFETFFTLSLYIIFGAFFIPLAFLADKNKRQEANVYLILCFFYIWKDASLSFIFYYLAKKQENTILSKNFIKPTEQNFSTLSNCEDLRMTIINSSVSKKEDPESNTIVFSKGVYYINSKFGKTSFAKELVGLTQTCTKIFESKNNQILLKNPCFYSIYNYVLYINCLEVPDISIRQFFLCESPYLTDKEIFEALACSGILFDLDKNKDVLGLNMRQLTEFQRISVNLSKLFLRRKYQILIAEGALDSLSQSQRAFILATIRRVPIALFLENRKTDESQNHFIIKKTGGTNA